MMRCIPLGRRLRAVPAAIGAHAAYAVQGRVANVSGLAVEVAGIAGQAAVGDRVELRGRSEQLAAAEIIGFRGGVAQAMALGPIEGLGPGSPATLPLGAEARRGGLPVSDGWLGRVVDPLGRPLDGRGPLPQRASRPLRCSPPDAAERARLGPPISLGVRALDLFATCRQGQRLGLFAGSGVGKSTLMAMLARRSACDVAVIALVGERGREVREFIEDELGAAGLARAVVVVATGDAPPLLRREAAYAAMTVAEHFRDRGRNVLLMMDSVTRFCLALREVALAAGEPPATRGYPPSVFAELPRLLERAGPGPDGPTPGHISALFTVLVEGDDHNEPVADAVRGILDGHIILDRRIGEGGRYPAVDVLRSLSRTVPGCLSPQEAALTRRARAVLALHAEMADMVRLGAYRAGSDPAVDEAIRLTPRIEAVLRQARDDDSDLTTAFAALQQALETNDGP